MAERKVTWNRCKIDGCLPDIDYVNMRMVNLDDLNDNQINGEYKLRTANALRQLSKHAFDHDIPKQQLTHGNESNSLTELDDTPTQFSILFPHTVQTTPDRLSRTIAIQQKLLAFSLIHSGNVIRHNPNDPSRGSEAEQTVSDFNLQKKLPKYASESPTDNPEQWIDKVNAAKITELKRTWVVKRKPDGTKYIVRRSTKSQPAICLPSTSWQFKMYDGLQREKTRGNLTFINADMLTKDAEDSSGNLQRTRSQSAHVPIIFRCQCSKIIYSDICDTCSSTNRETGEFTCDILLGTGKLNSDETTFNAKSASCQNRVKHRTHASPGYTKRIFTEQICFPKGKLLSVTTM